MLKRHIKVSEVSCRSCKCYNFNIFNVLLDPWVKKTVIMILISD